MIAYSFTACSVVIIPKCIQKLYSINCRMELFPSLNRIMYQALFCRSSPMHALSCHALIRLQNCNVSFLCVCVCEEFKIIHLSLVIWKITIFSWHLTESGKVNTELQNNGSSQHTLNPYWDLCRDSWESVLNTRFFSNTFAYETRWKCLWKY